MGNCIGLDENKSERLHEETQSVIEEIQVARDKVCLDFVSYFIYPLSAIEMACHVLNFACAYVVLGI